jgi:UDP-N-acetylmuramoylalanine--D-glutamate ligase
MRHEVNHTDHTISGKRISVIGAARSGVAAANLLAGRGARVFVSDAAPEEKLAAQLSELQRAGIPFEAGSHSERVFEADMMVVSPGVPSDAKVIRDARQRGIRIVSELEVAAWLCPSPIVAVTGTNGKTTTTTLIGRLLGDGRVKHAVAGNIGTAFSAVVGELDEASYAVLEVSSFQLDDTESFHPKVSIILNITPDHLDRYDHSFEKYIASKCRIFEHQASEDYLIYNYDDTVTRENVERRAKGLVRMIPFSAETQPSPGAFARDGKLFTDLGAGPTEIIATEEITIRGVHNLYNSMAAVLAAQICGVSVPSIRATLKNFKGVEHRLEFVRELKGVRYINDSKATNVDSVWYALQAYTQPIVVLLGGRDKGNDYARLFDLVKKHVKAIVAIGESAGKVADAFAWFPLVRKAASMEEAVATATSLAAKGDIVLLSPACASFDWFENYEHRGKVFKEIVNRLS